MPRMLDLCSGLGGASEAFVRAGWEVVRIDNNPLLAKPTSGYYVPYTIEDDILLTDLSEGTAWFWMGLEYDFIWASPECVEFSNAYASPKSKAARNGEEYEPDMSLVRACHYIIKKLNPKYWVMENVAGARPYISEELGMPPWQIVGPFFLWGRFPMLIFEHDWTHTKASVDTNSSHELRANHKAKIPLELSEAFLDAVSNQTSLARWTR
jgi:hypothetical protein